MTGRCKVCGNFVVKNIWGLYLQVSCTAGYLYQRQHLQPCQLIQGPQGRPLSNGNFGIYLLLINENCTPYKKLTTVFSIAYIVLQNLNREKVPTSTCAFTQIGGRQTTCLELFCPNLYLKAPISIYPRCTPEMTSGRLVPLVSSSIRKKAIAYRQS